MNAMKPEPIVLGAEEAVEADRYNALYAQGYPAGAPAAGLEWAGLVDRALRVLDIGCGWATLARRFDHYVGIDVSDYVIARNRATQPGRFEVCGALDAWRLFDGESFDLVLAADVLEHFPLATLDTYLANLAKLDAPLFLFSICCRASGFKDSKGEGLHLSVLPRAGWLERLAPYFDVISLSESNRQQTFHVLLRPKV